MERSILSWVCVCALVALPLFGCSDNDGPNNDPGPDDIRGEGGAGGSAPIKSGLWLGGSPASNTDGSPFDTGWAICFYVNEDGTALTPSDDCDIDGQDDDETWDIEVSWKADVGWDQERSEPGECNGIAAFDRTVAIEDNSFEIQTHGSGYVTGSFEGETATGTATQGGGILEQFACELVGGWTASPAP
jgi:hypothetical protein